MSKTTVACGSLALGCCLALLGAAQAQTPAEVPPRSNDIAQADEPLIRLAALPEGDALTASSGPGAGWAAPLAPAANSANALLVNAALAPSRPNRRTSDRVVVLASWVYGAQKPGFSETQTFTKYQEDTGSLNLRYAQPTGSGFSIDSRVTLWRGLGLQLGYSDVPRKGSVTALAQIPHPLLFQSNRTVTRDATGLEWHEGTFHLDVAYGRAVGPVRAAVFAGASFLSVKADLVEQLAYTQVYPYAAENVTVTSLTSQRVSKSAVGLDAGVALDLPIISHVGIGALVRYSGARVTLTRPTAPLPLDNGAVTGEQLVHAAPGSAAAVDARGVQLSLGARLFF